jgi:carboxyl-terminal processing protease
MSASERPADLEKDSPVPEAPPDDLPRSAAGFAPSRIGIILAAVLTGSILFLGGYTLGAHVATTPGTPASEENRFAPFWDVYDLINSSFAGSPRPSRDQLVRAAIDGMMKSLKDPYSYYENPDDFANSLLNVGGQQIGVGVVVQLQTAQGAPSGTDCTSSGVKIGNGCELAVVKPIPGSPAIKAGIQAGDVIAAIDGASVDGLSVDDAVARIKGKRGSTATLTVMRGGARLEIAVVRDLFDTPVVDTKTYANGAVEYISLTKVEGPGYKQFDGALAAALEKGRKNVIIDLRGNGGGYVQDAVKLVSEFIGSGPIVYQRGASGQTSETSALPGGRATDDSIRVVVLTDQGTASAAEIVAGALQARGRAVLVGDRTYGKGVVQEWLQLPNNAGGIHLTVADWFTPNHVWIQGKGLQPDIPVSTEGARAGTDPVLDAALVYLGFAAESGALASPSPSVSPSPSASPSLVPSPTPAAS